jgi:general secretion pathway protein H
MTGKPHHWRHDSRSSGGFTLLEILVVIVIIGIIVAAGTLALGVLGKDREIEDQTRRFWAVMQQAREEAELQGLDTGVYVSSSGYEFVRLEQRLNTWQPIEDDQLYAKRELPEGLKFRTWIEAREIVLKPEAPDWKLKEASKKYAPQILVLSSGDIIPFELRIERDGAEAPWRVLSLPDSDLRIERHDKPADEWQMVMQTKPPDDDDGKTKKLTSAKR